MAQGLRDRLIGAWNLTSCQEVPVDGSDPYTPDGYMSAQLAKPDRPHFSSGDWFTGSTDDSANQALKFFVNPEDIAALALFLASAHARSISGQTITIDGFSKAAQ